MTLNQNQISSIEQFLTELGGYLIEKQLHLLDVQEKGSLDLVTEADYEVERRISEYIQSHFPGDLVLGEEKARIGDSASENARIWVVDPLDGTVNYAWGSPIYSISLGLMEAGNPAYGWVFAPALAELFYAEAGKGSFLNGLRVDSTSRDPAELVSLSSGFLSAMSHSPGKITRWMESAKFRNLGSQALQLCYVAAGRLGANINWEAKIWDDFAGALVAIESGCHYESPEHPWSSDGLGELLLNPEISLQSVACHPSLKPKINDLMDNQGLEL